MVDGSIPYMKELHHGSIGIDPASCTRSGVKKNDVFFCLGGWGFYFKYKYILYIDNGTLSNGIRRLVQDWNNTQLAPLLIIQGSS